MFIRPKPRLNLGRLGLKGIRSQVRKGGDMLETELILAARLEDLRGSRQPVATYPSRQEAMRRRRVTAQRAGISADRILDLFTLLGSVTARTRGVPTA